MAHYDVFNGDADGMCALRQLRLAEPRASVRITGLKREIALLQRVRAQAGDSVTALDISLDTNREAVMSLLQGGVSVLYFDHHGSGDIPRHPALEAHIDLAPSVCTGMIVDRYLGGRYRRWAVVAAFGDNFGRSARALAHSLALDALQIEALQDLGECLNYNAYGDIDSDPVIHPASLYAILERFDDPFEFMQSEPVFEQLRQARRQDIELACQLQPHTVLPGGGIHVLPDAAWSRRVRGEFANMLANRDPRRAHAVLTPNPQEGFTVSVRAPLTTRRGARLLCEQFDTGGGRAAAAGVTDLPRDRLPDFIHAFEQAFPQTVS
ncbi:MAG TPA: acetyltransferase [Noviherbaspirillum sp.]|uniref:acetyltransferase n=1 Tax=Noviherbaspirillum sp. TaxID=1926288 RepID=UPI002B4902F0|nr:acetyltransferase [Noviherbaspirillum sp.]HJV84376.1 acetyltransferase [Noviherbaspirillum sp.]